MNRNSKYNSSWPSYSNNEIQKVISIMQSGKVNYWSGNEGKKFENEFSNYIGVKYSIAVSSGSVALDCALKSLSLGKNDEVIVTPRSYYISASCVLNAGARPVFVDISNITQNITLETIKKVLTKKTKVIICVHLAGYPCDMKPIINFAKKYNLVVIEDCAQAHGAKIDNKLVGSFGDISVWSFCNDKIISTCGEGGMISTNNKTYMSKIWSLKEIGKDLHKIKKINKDFKFKWVHDHIGSNYRMTEIQCAVGRIQLKKLNKNISMRNKIAKKYLSAIKNIKWIKTIKINNNIVNAYYRLNIIIDSSITKKNFSALDIIKVLNNNKIKCNEGACPKIYEEKKFKSLKLVPKRKLINVENLNHNNISIFISHLLTHDEIAKNSNNLNKIFNKFDNYIL